MNPEKIGVYQKFWTSQVDELRHRDWGSILPRWAIWSYEAIMAVLALMVVWMLTLPDQPWVHTANLMIWSVFVADYAIRLSIARDRRIFVRQNLLDLVTILPVDFLRVTRIARLARLVRLSRVAAVLWRVSKEIRAILATNGLAYVLAFTTILIVLGGICVWLIEPRVETIGSGIWWSVVTATAFVGHTDIVPSTALGRIVAVILMMAGISTIGMITGSITTHFISIGKSQNKQVEDIRKRLQVWGDLSSEERQRLASKLQTLANAENRGR